MLFLLNDQVLDLGDPQTCLDGSIGALSRVRPERLTPARAALLGQAIYFGCPPGTRPTTGARLALASLLALRTDANAAVFVRPDGARTEADVQYRLALVDLPVLAHLFVLQVGGVLDPRLVNESVWMTASS